MSRASRIIERHSTWHNGRRHLLSLLATALLPVGSTSANPVLDSGAGVANPSTLVESDTGYKFGSMIVAPIPFSSPLIGSGLTLGGGYLFTLPGSKPSGFGAAKLESSNGSSGWGVGGSLSFGEGAWSVFALYAEADVFYDLPIFGDFELPLNQDGDLSVLTVRRSVGKNWNIGTRLSYLDTDIRLDSDIISLLPSFLQPDLDISLATVHLLAEYDSRDDTFYPTKGTVADLDLAYSKEVDSVFRDRFELSSRSFLKFKASASNYAELSNADVVATRASFCAVGSDAPFFDTCGLGLVEGVRGFTAFDFLGEYSAAIQGEYRGRLSDRFGYVAFLGGGGTNNDLGDLFSDIHVAGGFGLRIRLSKKFSLDYAIDYALNDDGDHNLYLFLGQRF